MDCSDMLEELLELRNAREDAENALDEALADLDDESGFWEPETATTGSIVGTAILGCVYLPPLGCLLGMGVAAFGIIGVEGDRQEDIDHAASHARERMDDFALADLGYSEAYCAYIEQCVAGDDVEVPGLVPIDVY